LTPAHFIMSRLAENYLYPLAFILGWLLCLLPAEGTPGRWRLFAGGLLLGAGIYTYLGALVMMPVCVLVTCASLLAFGRDDALVGCLATVVGFGLMLVPLVVWLLAHPDAFGTLAGRYELYDPSRSSA